MLSLFAHVSQRANLEPFVARVTAGSMRPMPLREREALLVRKGGRAEQGFRAHLFVDGADFRLHKNIDGQPYVVELPEALNYLHDSDIVRFNPRNGELNVLYRCESRSNSMCLTERCNCSCMMCPQPPRNNQPESWIATWLDAVPLMSSATTELVITGGEPTLEADGLLRVIRACRSYLPRTAIQVLSNGRMFNYMSLCREVAELRHPDLVFGIPLYSDLADVHNDIVRTKGAYDQTIRGIMNLRRCDQRLEIRIVLLKQNVHRLADFARFVTRNLPFAEHVALMAMEPMGWAKGRNKDLGVDPQEQGTFLGEAIEELVAHHMQVSIFNLPLCVLPQQLWSFARKSISDWKTEYLDVCDLCNVRAECGGFFYSARDVLRAHVRPVEQ